MSGFKIEDWFEWIFCQMPWVHLVHALDQQQFPRQSKEKYQVPDFLVIVETSALAHQPLLVEVKRVPREKKSLKLGDSQVTLCQQYASTLNIPFVFMTYWDKFSAWTMNTVDAFERKTSARKLPVLKAFEPDCSAILGDISYLLLEPIVRQSRFTWRDIIPGCVQYQKYGRLLSDTVAVGDRRVELSHIESSVIDAMWATRIRSETKLGDGVTELIETNDDPYVPKLSTWITRHAGLLQTEPSEQCSNVSACVITDLMSKLGYPIVHLFPTGATEDLKHIDAIFRTPSPAKS